MTKFLIYDRSGKRVGLKSRKIVHSKGLWHRGVQLNIYYKGQILVQKRSEACDISWDLYDQSVAIQQIEEDQENDLATLKRGVKNELGVELVSLPSPQKVAGPYKIKKRYGYAPEITNNEFVTLYEVQLKKPVVFRINKKVVKLIYWEDINKLKEDVLKNPAKYTKTLAFWIKKGYL